MSNIKLNRIVLLVNGKEISLTLEEAKELYDALGELFEKKIEYTPYTPSLPYMPYTPYAPYTPYTSPWTYISKGTSLTLNPAGQWYSNGTSTTTVAR